MKKKAIIFVCFIAVFAGCRQEQKKSEEKITKRNPQVISLNEKAMGIVRSTLGNEKRADSLKLALSYLEQAIDIDPKEYAVYSNKASIQCELKDYANALKTFDMLIKLKDNNANALSMQGFLYEKIGKVDSANIRYNQAFQLYEQIVQKQSNNVNAQVSRAFILLFVTNKSDAMNEINEIIAKNPNNQTALNMRMIIGNFNRNDYINDLFH